MAAKKRVTPRLSAALLRELHACPLEVTAFEAVFGESAAVTKANVAKARKHGLNICWIYGNFMPEISTCPCNIGDVTYSNARFARELCAVLRKRSV